MIEKIKRKVLANGLTVIHCQRKNKSIAIQATAKIGSNHEDIMVLGMSHFLEHMLFEGTKKRSRFVISREIEGIGGDTGAYTTQEVTAYYAKALSQHFDKLLSVIS